MVCLIHTHTHKTHRRAPWIHVPKAIQKHDWGGGSVGIYLFISFFSLLRQNCCRNLEEVFSLSLKQRGLTFLGFKGDYLQGCSITLNRCYIPS